MIKNQIKEHISYGFVSLIANRLGFKCSKPSSDNGVDMQVTRLNCISLNGSNRYLDSGEYIEVQLKATTYSSVTWSNDYVKYDLEVKNYNDLINRLQSNTLTPLYLILFILPEEEEEWLCVDTENLLLKGTALWYRPEIDKNYSSNISTVRISIPVKNTVSCDFFDVKFGEVYG